MLLYYWKFMGLNIYKFLNICTESKTYVESCNVAGTDMAIKTIK